MSLIQFMCNERSHNICYATATYEVQTFKHKNKRYVFVYYFLLYICLFVAANTQIETRAYDMARDETLINSKVYIRVRSKAASGVL